MKAILKDVNFFYFFAHEHHMGSWHGELELLPGLLALGTEGCLFFSLMVTVLNGKHMFESF